MPSLNNQVIVLSGTFGGGVSHDSLKKDIAKNGGKCEAKITDDTTHLVATEKDYESKSTKVKQALESDNVKIVSLDWLNKAFSAKTKPSEKTYLMGSASSKADAKPAAGKKRGRAAKADADDAEEEDEEEEKPAPKKRGRSAAATKVKSEEPEDDTKPKKKGRTAIKMKAEEPEDDEEEEKKPAKKGGRAAKVKSEPKVEDEDEEEEKKPAKKGVRAAKVKSEPKVEDEDEEEEEVEEKTFKDGQKASSKNINVPLDEGCNLGGVWRVYIGDDGTIWDANLNQTNAGNNNNKFYRIQLLHNASGGYKTWTRWGRVGENGQSAALGGGDMGDAIRQFEKKFKDKSGLQWNDRLEPSKKGKYAFLERNYEPNSDDEDAKAKKKDSGKGKGKADRKPAESKLTKPVQQLMELIFNQTFFAATMADMDYDANKLPLGKLSKRTINQGFQALKDLAEVLVTPTLAQTKFNGTFNQVTEDLSNRYYTVIPHSFGRNRPPIIRDDNRLKKEIELLDSLSEMSVASKIMNESDENGVGEMLHQLDRQHAGLQMDEMEALDHKSAEFTQLEDYLIKTHGKTHYMKMKVEEIFRITRKDEQDRFNKSEYGKLAADRRLLWHGSRATNFGGILSQGLRIAPPEAPVSGYMFGKGVYLADISSKSAGYTAYHMSNNTGLLLLCEAELGKPMWELTGASYTAGEDSKKNGRFATWGKGMTVPSGWKDAGSVHPTLKGVIMPDTTTAPGDSKVSGAYLQYNEYICYDVAQICLRYLFRVSIN